ncbi:MAG: hypothetical protein HYZ51_03080 [Candidatus Doudnabacteria bacterium]|nr:hypothetical protein [Candidatus Doudnabacteria bacterium]
MDKFKRPLLIAIGGLLGLAGGYFYWQQIGCASGSCPITSNPIHSSIYGAVMGGLLLSIITNSKK